MILPVDISVSGVEKLESEIAKTKAKCNELHSSLNSLQAALSLLNVQINQPTEATAD